MLMSPSRGISQRSDTSARSPKASDSAQRGQRRRGAGTWDPRVWWPVSLRRSMSFPSGSSASLKAQLSEELSMKPTPISDPPARTTSLRNGWHSSRMVSDLDAVACALLIFMRSGELYGDFVDSGERRLRYTVYSAGGAEDPTTLLVVGAGGFIAAVTLAHS